MKLGIGFYRNMLTPDNFRFAKQAGASEVEVKISDHATIVIRIAPSTADQSPLANAPEIVL